MPTFITFSDEQRFGKDRKSVRWRYAVQIKETGGGPVCTHTSLPWPPRRASPPRPLPGRASARSLTHPIQLHSGTNLFQLSPPGFFSTCVTSYSSRPALISMPARPPSLAPSPPASSRPHRGSKSESEVINYANGSGSIMQKYYYDDSRPG